MSTITPGVFTYSEWAVRRDADGELSQLVNLKSQNNAILADMMAAECTAGNAFQFTQVTSLQTATRRSYNQGVSPGINTAGKQTQTAIEYAVVSQIDESLGQLGGQLAASRMQEDRLSMEGLQQKVASDLFYSNNTTDPTAFTGFSNIYNTVTTSTSQIANNVIDCGGTQSTNASLWLICWGPKQIHTIFPQGMMAGMQHIDRGLQPVQDAAAKTYYAYVSWLKWNIGLAIHDWRFAARACNIDVTLFGGGSSADLISILNALVFKPSVMPAGVAPVQTADDPNISMGRAAFYCNRTIALALDLQAQNKTNVLLKMEQWDGMSITTYRGIPIRIVDKLTIAETKVV